MLDGVIIRGRCRAAGGGTTGMRSKGPVMQGANLAGILSSRSVSFATVRATVAFPFTVGQDHGSTKLQPLLQGADAPCSMTVPDSVTDMRCVSTWVAPPATPERRWMANTQACLERS